MALLSNDSSMPFVCLETFLLVVIWLVLALKMEQQKEHSIYGT